MPKPTKAKAKERLQRALDEIPKLKQLSSMSSSREFIRWHRNAEIAIVYTFGQSSHNVGKFKAILYISTLIGGPDGLWNRGVYVGGLERASAILESMIDEIEEYWEDDEQLPDSFETPEMSKQTNTNRAFIIHGRDHGIKDTVARFLTSLGVEPVILQEQPDQGRTIIEKFEEYAQIDFAVALFTPDDLGGLDDGGNNLHPRTRQNVIFELGYFIGKFGRDRVRALVKGNIEIPSDYSGVITIPVDDSEGWQMELIGEMKSAGFDIDANRLFEELH